MNSDSFSQVRDLFEKASEADTAERLLLLDAVTDPELRKQVDALLAAHTRAGGFLATPAAALNIDDLDMNPADPLVGHRFGQYQIREVLGHGGMGVVYLAQQDHPRRIVALKVIRSPMLGAQLLRRFEHEAQVLGRLKHPGIAQIYEAGAAASADGRRQPFFAMELVRGPTLIDHATAVNLDVRGRLELMARVCDAVEHAHQRGVIHRDLKPANILVETGGLPKVLDFGVARVTDSDIAATTMQTNTGQVIGTIPYMSPEQVRGDAAGVDTRSDVYALGVILYELLTGRLPYIVKGKPITEAARVITEDEPTNPGIVSRFLKGEIATIVLKALAKEPSRRYASAAELGADLRRYLSDQPIAAKPATTVYQLSKFAKRNKILVAGVLGVLLALVVGVVGTSIELVRARRAETSASLNAARATLEAKRAKRTLDFVRRVLAASDLRNTGGKDFTMRDLLTELAVRARSELGDDPLVAGEIYDTIASSYVANSDLDRAAEFVALSERLRLESFGAESPEYALSLVARAHLQREQNKLTDATETMRRAIALFETGGLEQTQNLALALGALGEFLAGGGDAAGAEPVIRRAIDLLGDNPDFTVSRLDMQIILADVLWLKGDAQRAQGAMLDNIARAKEFYGEDHPKVAFTLMALARALQHGGKGEEAIPHLRAAADIFERVYPPGHRYRYTARENLAYALISIHQLDEADEITRHDLAQLDAASPTDDLQLMRAVSTTAIIAAARKDYPAEEVFRRRSIQLHGHISGDTLLAARPPLLALAQCLLNQNKLAEAGEILRPMADPSLDSEPTTGRLDALNLLARWLDASGEIAQVEETYRRALQVAADPRMTASARLQASRRYAGWLERKGRWDDAQSQLQAVRATLAAALGDENQYTISAARDLAALQERRDKAGK